jgi:hypothetical protein
MIGFDSGVRGFWNSTANLDRAGKIYGLLIQCQKALVNVRAGGEVFVYHSPAVEPENDKLAWEKVWVESWHFSSDHKPRPMKDFIHRGNQTLLRELAAAIAHDTEPATPLRDAVFVTEIIQGAYASHFSDGRRLPIPLVDRRHPFGS